jgi:mRNA interferase RelE/StbE
MYNSDYSDKLKIILKKLAKKNNQLYEQILRKIQDIINSESVEHYKNLKYSLRKFKRIHVGHFVLIFRYNENKNLISFEDFQHHDEVYKRR